MNLILLEERWLRKLTSIKLVSSFLNRERRKAVQLRDPAMYSMEVEVHFSSLPPHVNDRVCYVYCTVCTMQQLGEDNKLLIRVHYEAGSYQTFQVDSKYC